MIYHELFAKNKPFNLSLSLMMNLLGCIFESERQSQKKRKGFISHIEGVGCCAAFGKQHGDITEGRAAYSPIQNSWIQKGCIRPCAFWHADMAVLHVQTLGCGCLSVL